MSLDPCCISGALATAAKPVGFEASVAGVSAYISRPPSGTTTIKAIVLVSDVFGWRLPNVRLVADRYAQAGYLVVVPDFLHDDAVDPKLLDENLMKPQKTLVGAAWKTFRMLTLMPFILVWLRTHSTRYVVDTMPDIVADLRLTFGIRKVAAVGFCWGGQAAAMLAGTTGCVQAAVICHPAPISDNVVSEIRQNTFFVCAEVDNSFPEKARIKVEQTLSQMASSSAAQKNSVIVPEAEFNVYPGTLHGFVVRGSESDPVVCQAREQAHVDILDFLKRRF